MIIAKIFFMNYLNFNILLEYLINFFIKIYFINGKKIKYYLIFGLCNF